MKHEKRFKILRCGNTTQAGQLGFFILFLTAFHVQAESTNNNGIHLLSVTADLWTSGEVMNGTGEQMEVSGTFDGHFKSINRHGVHAEFHRPAIPAAVNTPTPTSTPNPTVSPTDTHTHSATPTPTYTISYTHTRTDTPAPTITATSSFTSTLLFTQTSTQTATQTQTTTWTITPAESASPTMTQTPSLAYTPTMTLTWTPSPTSTSSRTPSQTLTDTSTPTITATSTPADDDRDGIPNIVEEGGPDGGDSDLDGIVDSIQSEVAVFPNSVDGRYLTLISPPDTEFREVRSIPLPAPGMAALPEGATTPYGLLHFFVEGVSSKSRFMLTLLVPDDTQGLSYWKFGATPEEETPHWYEFDYDGVTGVEMSGRIVTLWFLDGARGDDDLTVNKLLVDLGGLFKEEFLDVTHWNLY